MPKYRMLIDGKLVDGAQTLDVINPATGEAFTQVARADEAQVLEAIAAAKRAQPAWAALPIDERRASLHRLADAIRDDADTFARTLVQEQGKPLEQAQAETAFAEIFLRYYADQSLDPELIQDDADYRVEMHYRPLGVVAGITPWNFPLLIGVFKLAPALLLGNTYIWKPAPTTPVMALMLAERAAGIFPPGVVNVVVDQNDLGAVLSKHPDVAKVTFTGSTATGRKVMEAGASTLKRLTLELGGNDAGIVLPDADVRKTAERAIGSAFSNSGQVCIALKRLYVHSSIYDEMCEALAEEAAKYPVGDGLQQGTRVGPLQNAAQFAKAKEYLAAAKQDGKIIAGGEALPSDGYFIQPTVVRDITNGSRLVDEEQFSPILPVISYDDIDQVIDAANDSEYGLGGSIWSNDTDSAMKLADRIASGTVWINHHTHFGPHIPFAGAKQSGVGVEFGREGLTEFAQRSVVNLSKQ
ncbi:aldehyde dehydrogenase [Croceicoccus estronivorus]|uniref:aldehyde dehydrogenase family protein n=1 Tax=Croceicoccus estronivorus TaxID=1172626 RepID=UPI00082C3EB1|nr:aldehyde dehydrogenase family protein [Croceicoccus estronivorus]OCC23398.1 aldehyde dehydrogenase [Croceicoccus estronivorus]